MERNTEEKLKVYGIYEQDYDERNEVTKRLKKDGYVIIRDRGRVYAVKKDKEMHNAD